MIYELSLEFFVHAAPHEVMLLLTDEVFINEWSGGESLIEKKAGGQFAMFDGWVEGIVLKITEDELAYTWKPGNWEEGTAASEVQYKLTAVNDGTAVFLKHTGIPTKEEMEAHKTGWDKNFFGLIAEYLSKRN